MNAVGAPILLMGNGVRYRNSAYPLPFRQDSSFLYYTGCHQPEAALQMINAFVDGSLAKEEEFAPLVAEATEHEREVAWQVHAHVGDGTRRLDVLDATPDLRALVESSSSGSARAAFPPSHTARAERSCSVSAARVTSVAIAAGSRARDLSLFLENIFSTW